MILYSVYGFGGFKQLQTAPWHGVNFADLLFPWFLFCMCVSIPYQYNIWLEIDGLKWYHVLFKLFATLLKKNWHWIIAHRVVIQQM